MLCHQLLGIFCLLIVSVKCFNFAFDTRDGKKIPQVGFSIYPKYIQGSVKKGTDTFLIQSGYNFSPEVGLTNGTAYYDARADWMSTFDANNTALFSQFVAGKQLGQKEVEEQRETFGKTLAEDRKRNTYRYILGGESYTPEEIFALALRFVKHHGEMFVSENITRCVASISHESTQAERKAVLTAMTIAGCKRTALLSDAAAELLYYGGYLSPESHRHAIIVNSERDSTRIILVKYGKDIEEESFSRSERMKKIPFGFTNYTSAIAAFLAKETGEKNITSFQVEGYIRDVESRNYALVNTPAGQYNFTIETFNNVTSHLNGVLYNEVAKIIDGLDYEIDAVDLFALSGETFSTFGLQRLFRDRHGSRVEASYISRPYATAVFASPTQDVKPEVPVDSPFVVTQEGAADRMLFGGAYIGEKQELEFSSARRGEPIRFTLSESPSLGLKCSGIAEYEISPSTHANDVTVVFEFTDKGLVKVDDAYYYYEVDGRVRRDKANVTMHELCYHSMSTDEIEKSKKRILSLASEEKLKVDYSLLTINNLVHQMNYAETYVKNSDDPEQQNHEFVFESEKKNITRLINETREWLDALKIERLNFTEMKYHYDTINDAIERVEKRKSFRREAPHVLEMAVKTLNTTANLLNAEKEKKDDILSKDDIEKWEKFITKHQEWLSGAMESISETNESDEFPVTVEELETEAREIKTGYLKFTDYIEEQRKKKGDKNTSEESKSENKNQVKDEL